MKKLFLILFIASSLLAQGQKNYLTTRSFNRGSTLYNGLIAFWKFDNSWADSWGNNDLNPFGGAYVSATGFNGQAASFERDSSQYAYCADNADLSMATTEHFAVAAWVKSETLPGTMGIIAKHGDTTEYQLISLATSGKIRFGASNGIGLSETESGTGISNGTWYFVCGWYNYTTDSVYIQINNGSVSQAKCVYNVHDGTNDFKVGKVSGTQHYDGTVDDLGIWSRQLTAATGKLFADSLYNSGNGWRP